MIERLQLIVRVVTVLLVLILVGCAGSFERPQNLVTASSEPYQAQRQSMSDSRHNASFAAASSQNMGRWFGTAMDDRKESHRTRHRAMPRQYRGGGKAAPDQSFHDLSQEGVLGIAIGEE